MNYATFWQRFAAMWIDAIIFMPLVFLQTWLESFSKKIGFALVMPMAAAYCAYTIYCHGRYGQTVGKYVVSIRVLNVSGGKINWRQAWLRSSIDVVFSILGLVGTFVALATVSDADHYAGWMRRSQALNANAPAWLGWVSWASQVWIWSEVVVMLLNKRRRALHDFIAGTVIAGDPQNPKEESRLPETQGVTP